METNLLGEFQVEQPRASKTLRFVNYVVDTLIFYFIVFVVIVFIGITSPEIVDNPDFTLWYYLVALIVFLLYFSVFETFANGRTIGKLITGTRAVKEDGSPIKFSDAFKRALSRITPFEAFSGFAERPWHDSWTKTTVVKN